MKNWVTLITILLVFALLAVTIACGEEDSTPTHTPILTLTPAPTPKDTYVDGSLKVRVVDICAGELIDEKRVPVVNITVDNIGKFELNAPEIYAIGQGKKVSSITIAEDTGLLPGESETGTWTLHKIWQWIDENTEIQVVGIAQDSAGTGYRVDFAIPPVKQLKICGSQ
jgi:hypothetical protein